MKINNIKIKNFRSISNTSFDIRGGKVALVGGNESGKSNILLAIQTFLNKRKLESEDKYQLSPDNAEIEVEFDNLLDSEKLRIEELTGNSPTKLVVRRIVDEYSIISPKLQTDDIETQEKTDTEDEALAEEGAEKPKVYSNQEVTDEIIKLLPKVFFIKTIDGLIKGKNLPVEELFSSENKPEKVTLTDNELKTIKDFLALGGIVEEDITDEDAGKSFHILNQKAAIIAQKLSAAWKQERIEIRMSADATNLVIEFKDCGNVPDGKDGFDSTKWVWTYPEDRSDGFRWFVTFYSSYLFGISKTDNAVFLIDEAGGALNKKAQLDLLSEFDRLSGNEMNNQIVYATHSKYMVSWDFRNDVYAIIKIKGKGTTVISEWWSKYSNDKLPAPLDELDVTWSGELLSPENLIVEGPVDLEVMRKLLVIFGSESIPSDNLFRFKMIPAMGIYDSMIQLSKACEFHNKKSFLLFDSDTDGLTEKTKAINDDLKAEDIATLSALPEAKIFTIEDFLPRKQYLKYLNEAGEEVYKDNWSEIKTVQGVEDEGLVKAIKKRLTKIADLSEIDIDRFIRNYKYQIAMSVLKDINIDDFSEIQKEAIKNFYTNLNEKLKHL